MTAFRQVLRLIPPTICRKGMAFLFSDTQIVKERFAMGKTQRHLEISAIKGLYVVKKSIWDPLRINRNTWIHDMKLIWYIYIYAQLSGCLIFFRIVLRRPFSLSNLHYDWVSLATFPACLLLFQSWCIAECGLVLFDFEWSLIIRIMLKEG